MGYGLAAVGLLMVCVGCVDVLYHSQVGWALEAVRDDERYAVSRGLPVYRLQMSAFVVSGLFAGLAGGLFVLYFSAASPDLFGFSYLTLVLAMVFLGGVNTVYGPVAGAVVLTTVGNVVQNAATASLIVPGVIIVAVLLFFRTGLVGVLPAVSRGWGDLRAGQRTSSWGRCVWRRGDGFTKGRKRG